MSLVDTAAGTSAVVPVVTYALKCNTSAAAIPCFLVAVTVAVRAVAMVVVVYILYAHPPFYDDKYTKSL